MHVTRRQVAYMEKVGNGRANAYYEATLDTKKPEEGGSSLDLERYAPSACSVGTLRAASLRVCRIHVHAVCV